MGFGDDNVRISNHKAKVNSKLGKFYSEALKIYNAYWFPQQYYENAIYFAKIDNIDYYIQYNNL